MRLKLDNLNIYNSDLVDFKFKIEAPTAIMDSLPPPVTEKKLEEATTVQTVLGESANTEEVDKNDKEVSVEKIYQPAVNRVDTVSTIQIVNTYPVRQDTKVEQHLIVTKSELETDIFRNPIPIEEVTAIPFVDMSEPREMAWNPELLSDSVAKMDSIQLGRQATVATTSIDHTSNKKGIPLPITLESSEGVFVLLLSCFFLFAYVYSGGIAFFRQNVMLIFSFYKSEKLESQPTTKEVLSSFFLLFFSMFIIAISIYEALDRIIPVEIEGRQPFATVCILAVFLMIFVGLKLLFNKLIGFIFDIGKKITAWNQSYIVLLSMLGILCFLPTLILVYSYMWHNIIIGFVLSLFLIVQIILLIRLIIYFVEQKHNVLYLIAYLCAVEILPYIFLALGLVYLYRVDILNIVL